METIDVLVGRIGKAHGLRGDVTINVRTDEPDRRFAPGSVLDAEAPSGSATTLRKLTVASYRWHSSVLLVRFEEIPDRTAAEALSGTYLFVPADSSPELPEGEFWPHQILGAEVRTESGRSLGTIAEIVRTQANDVWVAKGEDGEALIPALRDLVVSVDLSAGRVVVREVPGLTVPEQS